MDDLLDDMTGERGRDWGTRERMLPRGRRSRHVAGEALLALIHAGCAADARPGAALLNPKAAWTARLPVESAVPLRPPAFVRLLDGRLLAADAHQPKLWLITPGDSSGHVEVATLDPGGSARIVDLDVGPAGISILRGSGDVVVLDAQTFRPVRTIAYDPLEDANTPLRLRAHSDGSWTVMSRGMRGRLGTASRHAVVALRRLAVGQAPRELLVVPLWRPSEPGRGPFEVTGLGGSGDTLLVSRSDPPRLFEVRLDGPPQQPRKLRHAPRRRVAAAERREFEAAVAGLPTAMRTSLRVPEFYPPVLEAHPVGRALLVFAQGAGETKHLDLYCDERLRGTLLADPSVVGLWKVAGSVLALFERPAEDFYELRSYADADLQAGCP